jgi:lipopolysaccharide/colanic/teichoic acid biosynthesis glycosyltransferase
MVFFLGRFWGQAMGQETYTRQHSKKTETTTVSLGDNLAISEPSLAVLFGQQRAIVPSVVESYKTSTIADVLIRGFDIAGSLIMLAFAAPVMLLTALLIRGTSSGPVLFKQRRVGKNGKIFVLYKFRTMVNDAEKNTGPVWAAKEDDRVTPVGRILRRTRLDELPQLFNVLAGDMGLVGPRPERPYFVRQHRALQGIRLAVKPGITGLAQIRAFYDLKPEHKLKYDFLYIQKRSFFLNAYILLMTIPVVLLRKGW